VVAVALLAVLAVVFGLAGTVAPMPNFVSPQQSSSDSVTHFTYPPTFDSGWLNITDKCGQYFTLVHNLSSMDVTVDITGRTAILTEENWHQFWSMGDVNRDGYIDDTDMDLIAAAWGSYPGHPNWNPDADLNQDLIVDMRDVGILNFNYGRDIWTYFGAGVHQRNLGGTAYMGWSRTYGGASDDYASSVVQTSDGGYAIAGLNSTYPIGPFDLQFVKTDSAGNMQWIRTYGGTGDEGAYSIVQTGDGGYAIAGYTRSFGAGENDFWLVKTDSSGNVVWNQTYGGALGDVAYSVVQTVDGGYALAGRTWSYGAGGNDFWLVKTNSSGALQWNQTYGGATIDYASSVVQTVDGGYALAGRTDSYGAGFEDFWLVKTDSSGNTVWSQTYGGASDDYASSVVQTSDGGYAIAGYTNSYGASVFDFWLVKTDVEMGLAWTSSTSNTITLYRGRTDAYWNFVRVRVWTVEEPTWQFGDINQDGVVDAKDLAIIGKNYGKTFSALSLGGIIAIAGIYTYKKRKQPK